MDERRFDALTRRLGQGVSRRSLIKGFLGLAGAAVAGGQLRAEAARRPTPTPKPVTCPGNQTWNGSACVCPTGATNCGPDCCPVGQAECCDNACCFGRCYGEELCCPSSQEFCPVSGECCPVGWTCCPDFGCIAPGQCCTDSDCVEERCRDFTCVPYAPILLAESVPAEADRRFCQAHVTGTGFAPNTVYPYSTTLNGEEWTSGSQTSNANGNFDFLDWTYLNRAGAEYQAEIGGVYSNIAVLNC